MQPAQPNVGFQQPQYQQQQYGTAGQPMQPLPIQGYGQPVPGQVFINTHGPPAPRFSDYLLFNVFMTIFCFCPVGLAGIVYSIKARDAHERADDEPAKRLSRRARCLGFWALGLGIFLTAVIIVLVALGPVIFWASVSDDADDWWNEDWEWENEWK